MLKPEPETFKINERLHAVAMVRYHAEDIEKSHNLQFFRYEEDGLGPTIGGVFTASSGRNFVLTEHLLSPCPRLCIDVPASQAGQEALDDILGELNMGIDDCLWTMNDGYEAIPHVVYREDDNGHRSLVGKFRCRTEALIKIDDLSVGGHKQYYWAVPTEGETG